MKVRLTRDASGVSRLYREDLMGDDYDPPGPAFTRDDEGRRVADLTKTVATNLIDAGLAEAVDPAPDEETDLDTDDDEPPAEARAFVRRSWNTVTGEIDDGKADGFLGAIRTAEHDRDNGPRESVLKALDEREARPEGEA